MTGEVIEGKALMPVSEVQRALALAEEAGDLKAMRDVHAMANALQKGAQARGMGVEAENVAAEVVLRAERAMGLALLRMAEEGKRLTRGTIGQNKRVDVGDERLPTLADLGVRPQDAHFWQSLATKWQDDEFEHRLGQVKLTGVRLSKVDFYRGPKKDDRKVAAARKEVAEERPDPGTSYDKFMASAGAVIETMSDLDTEQLRNVATVITALVTAYNEVRRAR